MTSLDDLPLDISRMLVDKIANAYVDQYKSGNVLKKTKEVCKTLQNLTCSTRMFRDILGQDHGVWHNVLDFFSSKSDEHSREVKLGQAEVTNGTMTAKRAVQLVSLTGCEICGKSRIRKVHWTFGTRCCQDCLYSSTISDYRLVNDFGLGRGQIVPLKHTTVEMYKPGRYGGAYTLRFYWLKDPKLIKLCNKQHGFSFESVKEVGDELERLKQLEITKSREEAAAAKELANKNKNLLLEACKLHSIGKWYAGSGFVELIDRSGPFIKAQNRVKKYDEWAKSHIDTIFKDVVGTLVGRSVCNVVGFSLCGRDRQDDIEKEIEEMVIAKEDLTLLSPEYIARHYKAEFDKNQHYLDNAPNPLAYLKFLPRYVEMMKEYPALRNEEFIRLTKSKQKKTKVFQCPFCTMRIRSRGLVVHVCTEHRNLQELIESATQRLITSSTTNVFVV